MFNLLTIARALSDENRVRILMALRQQALCVCQITALLDLAPSTTSKHLSILRQSRLIESDKEGRWVYYRLAGSGRTQISPTLRLALDWVTRSLDGDPDILADEARLVAIRADHNVTELPETCHSPELHRLDATVNPTTLNPDQPL